ncbi:hypothetical protein [Shewanella sp.]|uniref:hypothetical protein n=1 Tax=Shewanella sp. TaxID=50422 RepID=UPI0026346B7B|nr:hypothetical protein [Shewanella sp.]
MDNSTLILNLKSLVAISDSTQFDSFVFIFNLKPEKELEAKKITEKIIDSNKDFFYELYKKDGELLQITFVKEKINNWFSNYQEFFNEYLKLALKSELSEIHKFCYVHENENYQDKVNAFLNLQKWINLFKKVTKNYFYSHDHNSITFHIFEDVDSDKKVRKHEIIIDSEETQLNLMKINKFPASLDISENCIYNIEKHLVLKIATLSTIKSKDDNFSLTRDILCNADEFIERYEKGYEFYINKYSIDKIIREVEKAKIDYFEKINNIINDNQTKSMSIPAIILGTSLVRSWNLSSAALIISSMLLAAYWVYLNLTHKIESIDDCVISAEKVLDHVKNEQVSEVEKIVSECIFKNSIKEIKKKSKSAKNTICKMIYSIFIAIFIWAIYLILNINN